MWHSLNMRLPCFIQTRTISELKGINGQQWNLTEAQLKDIGVIRPEDHRWDDDDGNPGENPLTTSECSRQSHDQPALTSASAPCICILPHNDLLWHPLVHLAIQATSHSALDFLHSNINITRLHRLRQKIYFYLKKKHKHCRGLNKIILVK